MRQASIDLLRTFAIALMVLVHFLENLAGALWTPAGFGAPLFAFLAGVSFRIWVLSQESKGRTETEINKVAVRRGLFLFVTGLFFNFAVWLPGDLYNWDVLTMIGTALIALAFARHLPGWFLALICGLAVLVSPFLRLHADYDSHWLEMYFQHDGTLGEIILGYLATGYFPLFPWVAFPIAGYTAGRVVFPNPEDAAAGPPPMAPLIRLGAVFLAVSVLLRLARPHLPSEVTTTVLKGWTMFPASWEYCFGAMGFALVAFGGLHVLVDRRQKLARVPWLLNAARTMSQYSLTMYLLHHALHVWPLWIYGGLTGDDVTRYWRNALPISAAVPLTVVCLVLCFLLFRLAAKYEFPTAETLMRWVCD